LRKSLNPRFKTKISFGKAQESHGFRKKLVTVFFGSGNQGGDVIRRNAGLFAALTVISLFTTPASAAVTMDPEGSGVLVNAVHWLEGTLLGTFATVVAVIAVASVGFMMLTGRIDWRRGAVVILGCFILFGAASIVAGIRSAAVVG
jgi:type IV secretion system protein VirB2